MNTHNGSNLKPFVSLLLLNQPVTYCTGREFLRRDIEIIVVGPEDAGAFQQYWNTEDLQFVGLPDPKHKVLKLYGQEVKLFKFGRMPAQMLIDKSGMLRFVHYGHSMSDIPSNEEILSLMNLVETDANNA